MYTCCFPPFGHAVGVSYRQGSTGKLRGALAAVVAGVMYRSARTAMQTRTIVPVSEPRPAVLPPKVTVVIPARNEVAVIANCLRSVRAQTHGEQGDSPLRVVVVDDGSSDGTGEIARAHADEDSRVKVVRVDGPPQGWSGKVHAMYAGVENADPPEAGEWLLFVDADTVLAPDLIDRLIATAEAVDADLVSTPGGPPPGRSLSWPLLMPPGLQMIGENAGPDGRGRKAFAIGHCILLRRSHYEKIGGWAALASRRNEDVEIATAIRDHGGATRTVDGLDYITTSGMDPFSQGWESFRKSFVAGTKGSVPALVGIGLGQLTLSLASPTAVAVGLKSRRKGLAAFGLLGWAVQSFAHARTAKLMRANPEYAAIAPVSGALFGALLLDGALRTIRGKTAWKGRRTKF